MPFKNDFKIPKFSQSDQGLAMVNEVLQAELQSIPVAPQPVITATAEDIGIPTPDEDLTQFQADPTVMPWSTEARQARELTFTGTTSETEQYKQMMQAHAEYQASNTITPEDVDNMAFLDRIASVESQGSGNYAAQRGNMTGRYQFDWSQWGDDIMRETGVKSKAEFINNPKAQDAFMSGWYGSNVLDKEAGQLYEQFKTVYPDGDMESLKMAVHLAGGPNIRNGIKNGTLKNWKDRKSVV